MNLRKKKYSYDKGQNYSTTSGSYIDQMEEFYREKKILHWSHRQWLSNRLVAAGKQVPADDRAMLDAVRGV